MPSKAGRGEYNLYFHDVAFFEAVDELIGICRPAEMTMPSEGMSILPSVDQSPTTVNFTDAFVRHWASSADGELSRVRRQLCG